MEIFTEVFEYLWSDQIQYLKNVYILYNQLKFWTFSIGMWLADMDSKPGNTEDPAFWWGSRLELSETYCIRNTAAVVLISKSSS